MHDSPIEGFRLSPQQRRLWKLQEAEGADPFPALCAVSVEGVIVPETFRDAVEQTVRRHEILRTTFHLLPRMDAPIQAVGEGRFDFTQIPAPKERPPGGEQALIDTLVEEAARLPFDLKNGSVLRLTLHALSDSTHLLIVTLPALCADVLTLTKLVGEIAKAYTALLSGEQHAAETIQYADVSEWQNELLEAEDAHAGKDYWRRQELHTARPLSLFDEHPGGEQAVYDPRRFRVMLPASVMAEVKALAFEYTCSPQAVVLSCWQAVLWRLTGESEVVVSAAFKGRQYAELEDGLGLFAKYLPVRALLKEELTFADLTKAVEASLDESGRWQEYFIEDGGTRSEGKTGTLGVGFEFIEWPRPINAGGLSFSFRRLYSHFDRFKVKLTCHQTDDALLVEFQYDGALLRQQTIERLAANLQTLLTDALARPRAAIQSLDILGSDERRALLYEFNATATAQPTSSCFHTVFERQVEETPDAAAVSVGRTTYSYRELNERANKLARRLREAGVGPEVLVGILLSRSVEMVVGLLGVLKAGGAYVPFDISQPARRLGFMLEDAGVTLLLCHESTSDTELPPHLKLMRLDADWAEIESYSAGNLPPSALPDNLAYVIYTSGSTGRPKGVQVTHASLVNLLSSMQRIPGLTSSDTLLAVTTISFDIAALELFLPLVTGARLVIATRDEAHDAGRLAGLLSDFSVTVMQATPATWRLLVESGWAGSAGLKILCGGEALARSLAEELAGRGAAVWNLYGPTETTIWSAAGRVDGGTGEGLVSIGGPIANTQMYVLDAELEPAPVGVVGELYIGGEGLARGYLNRPELTAERFVPHPHGAEAGARLYRTGDVARYRSDGGMEVVGRMDQQVKLRGHRIELGEVESVLNGCEGVSQAVVLLREDAPGDRRLVAYLSSGAEAESITTTELREYLRERLPEYMMPSAFVMLREWPLTPNGKVDRKALPAPDRSTRPDGAEHAAPRSRAEKVLADIWAEVLGMESVGINDNFFELGGDSILGIQAVARANRAGFELIPRQLFQHQTIAALASAAGPAPVLRTEQGAVTGSVPLTPVQHWFFEKDLPDPHHSNQSVLLEVRGGLNISALEESVRLLLAHHDALRLRFARTETGWQQWHAAADEPVPVSLVVLPSATDEEYREAVSAAAAEAQATLNLFHGPLMRVTAFRSERGLPDRLHVAIHQLAVDGVSWRVLFEDLQLCYEELAEGRTPRLPPKTTSYQYWAQRLSDYAQTEAVRQEAAYWLWETGTLSEPLPIDFEGRGESGHADSARTVSVSLGAEATAGLLYDAPRSYRVQVNDVLLTALARSFARWTANNSLMVCVESHGRQDIFGDVDFTRTVGWFTALFPVRLTLPGEAHPGEQLKAIKEQLRRVPNHGLGYGLLRYLCRDAQTARSVGELASPEVLFNYFGNVDQALPDASPFTLCEDEARRERSPSESRGFMFEVNTYVTDGSLVSNWTYDSNLHRRETVEALAEGFMESVRLLADYCRGAETTAGYTPSDFPKSKLNQTELDHLLSKISASRGELA